MTDHPDTGKRRGIAACHLCGKPVNVRVSKKGLLYYICNHADEGCGHQLMTRTKDAETHLARHIDKWDDPAQRKAYLGDAALPQKARPAEEPEPEDDDGEETAADLAPAETAAGASSTKRKPKRAAPPPPRAGFRLGGWKG